MKTVFLNILLLFFLNSFSKATYNDTIATKLYGQGCGIIPNSEEVDYNIILLEKLQKTELGSYVICENKDLLYEEAPQAYKDIDIVVQDLVDDKIVEVIAIFRPIITYKTRRK